MAQLKSTNITGNLAVSGNILASKIIKLGGTASQILMADGSTLDKSSIGSSDIKVQVNPYTDDAEYPIVLNPSVSGAPNTNTMGFRAGVTINPSTSTITANYFDGFIVGGRKTGTTIGDNATAEGYNTTASGNYSHAEGYNATASGESSHAEGTRATASGEGSHAEGCGSAQETCSHAEGASIASGPFSHAEGANTSASGRGSHSEGSGTTASGDYSHAEGFGATASGKHSHAEGSNTKVTNNSTVTAATTTSTTAGDYGHAEGYGTVSYGTASHAEGNGTTASGNSSHAEGYYTTSSGDYSHAEGINTNASGDRSHAEGFETVASGNASHSEGALSTSSGDYSHAEGGSTIASGNYSHVQGKFNIEDTTNTYAHIVGNGSSSARSNAHTLDWDGNAWFKGNVRVGGTSWDDATELGSGGTGGGSDTKVQVNPYTDNAEYPIVLNPSVSGAPNTNTMGFKAGVTINPSTSTITASYFNGYIISGLKSGTTLGDYATAEGLNTRASGDFSHGEGNSATASGQCAHAEGLSTTASGSASHAEGTHTTASGNMSHAEGVGTTASGAVSHAGGYYTIANSYQCAIGKFNTSTTAPTSLSDTTTSAGLFIVGIGTSNSARSNGFRINPAGNVYGVGSFNTSGADYAEYFEWLDGNPNNEDRRGHFVTLDGDKIRYATIDDDYILGVVSAEPSVVGDAYSEDWHNRYLKDIYGNKIVEVVEVEETTDENGEIIPAHTERRWVLNPDYDPNATYVSREERPEWAAIGILGKLVVVDDGTCQVNGYCQPNTGGIATASQEKTSYRVMERLDDTHIRIFIR